MSFCRFYLSYLLFHVFQGGTVKVFNKKSSTILILKTLQEYSDEDHYLTHQDIINRIKRDYGLEFERKSVASSIALLQELGYDINKGPKGGFALFSRLFEPSEIQFITDALFSSKAISAKQAAALSSKAQSVLSRYQRKNYNYILKADQIARNESDEVFYAIDMIHESIKQEKAISFQMKEYDEDGQVRLRMGDWRYKVSPYYLVSSNGFYYLIAHYRSKYAPIQAFRMDLMTNLQIEEDWAYKPLSSLEGMANFDIATYINEHIYLWGGDSVEATLEILKPAGIQYLKDWFGKHASIYKEGEKLYAKVRCNEGALRFWVLQYGEEFKLLSPESMVGTLKEHLAKENEKYA